MTPVLLLAAILAQAQSLPTPAGTPVRDAYDDCMDRLAARQPKQPPPVQPVVPLWRPSSMPVLADDLSRESLVEAARRTAAYWQRDPRRVVAVGGRSASGAQLAQAMLELAAEAQNAPDVNALQAWLDSRFEAFQSMKTDCRPPEDCATNRVTGYYSPTIPIVPWPAQGAAPIYAKPGVAIPRGHPDYTTHRIYNGALRNKAAVLYGAPNPADTYTIQLQGSGWGRLPDGRTVFFSWAGGNGHKFQALSEALHFCGFTPRLLGVRAADAHLKSLPFPEQLKAVSLNPSYVFFSAAPTGNPTGKAGIPLTARRSAAVDDAHVPLGMLAVLSAAAAGRPFTGLLFSHDVGGAIKGGGRLDYYFGAGAQAEADASVQSHPGKLFILMPK